MKTLIKRIFITSLLLALPCAPLLHAGEAKVAKAQKTYPNYTADEIWQRLKKTISIKNNKLTVNMVEGIWGVKLQNRPHPPNNGIKEVYTPLFMIEYFGVFEFRWGDGIHAQRPNGLMRAPTNVCITFAPRLTELKNDGWVLAQNQYLYPDELQRYVLEKYKDDPAKSLYLRIDTDSYSDCINNLGFYFAKKK